MTLNNKGYYKSKTDVININLYYKIKKKGDDFMKQNYATVGSMWFYWCTLKRIFRF